MVYADKLLYFITNHKLGLMSLQGTYDLGFLYVNLILIPKLHTILPMNYTKYLKTHAQTVMENNTL